MAVTSNNNLRLGSSGTDVLDLQKRLNSTGYGYNLAEDGSFGEKTLAAVKDYQKRSGLAVDGIVGTNTWGALTKAQTTTAPITTPTTKVEAQQAPTWSYTKSDQAKQNWDAYNDYLTTQKPGEYDKTYYGALQDALDKIMNREKFSYDLNGDALYQQYKDQYTTQGKMAMMDTMGQAQAMTGGYGNSYAQSVGQQAYQGYLQQLNDKVPELYQFALDQYNQEGQDLYAQASLLGQMDEQEFNRNQTSLDNYYKELGVLFDNAKYMSETEYERAWNDFQTKYTSHRDQVADDQWTQAFEYQQGRDQVADDQWQAQFDEAKLQYDQQMGLTREQFEWEKAHSGSGGSGGGTSANTLWYATGTYDDSGNPIFRNSEGKTQAFGQGINPYTGTKHPDAKHGTFSNGYQPNNIGGTKLRNSGMSTNVTGKSQTIWQANGKYWLWRGDLNKYVEVDVSDIDQ